MTRALLEPATPYMRHPLRPHQLLDPVTRTEDAIVLCHFGVPRLDVKTWSLSIDGLVRRPLQLTHGDLMRRPRAEVMTVHECCGSPFEPDDPKRRVCNVTWGGVRLSDLLAECEPEPSAHFVWSRGADYGVFGGVACDAYVKDLPLGRVGHDVLIACELNGAPLPPEHGHPARLVIPGFYGTNSVKWLTRLTLAADRVDSPFTTRWYVDQVRDAAGKPTGQNKPVWAIAPESLIVSPEAGARLLAGQAIEVWGWAWADGGAATVELSVDGGTHWQSADLAPPNGRAWQRFIATWSPREPGDYVLASRASSADDRQPDAGARNAVHRVAVRVE